MLEKFISVKNVGRFSGTRFSQGDVAFRKLTMIYAGNGLGKSTLCAVLRSMAGGNADLIAGRTTLGTTDVPGISIRIAGSTLGFAKGKWDAIHADIRIFDTTFINENVYAGDVVAHEHKKNLYRVIVGETGTALAHEIEAIDSTIRTLNRDIGEKAVELATIMPKGMDLKNFLILHEHPDIEKRIEEQKRTVEALSRSTELLTKDSLRPLNVPGLPKDFESVLSRTIDDLSTDAANKVQDHIATSLKGKGEQWLSQGVAFGCEEDCPYCGQDLKGVVLVDAIKSFFGKEYKQLQADVSSLEAKISHSLGEGATLSMQKQIASNSALLQFWQQFIDLDECPMLSFDDECQPVIKTLRETALAHVERKSDALLEQVTPDKEMTDAQIQAEYLRLKIERYNQLVDEVNAAIEAQKQATKGGSLVDAKQLLAVFEASQIRFEPASIAIANQYQEMQAKKDKAETEKAEAKRKMDEHADAVLAKYEGRINELLGRFGANFRIVNTARRYVGGTPSSSYQLEINKVQIELGDENTPVSKPSFRNTLSAGDRSALAFAFFIAQAESDPRLADKLLVFDDPFTSQDRSRRTCTQQCINRISLDAMQVIVFSHDPAFLRTLWDGDRTGSPKAIQLSRLGGSTIMTEWDIEKATMPEYLQLCGVLTAYLHDGVGSEGDVVQKLRPLLEQALRFKFPGQFGDKEWLGDMIQKIRVADAANPLSVAQDVLLEIEDINDYSKRYHHGGASASPTDPVDPTELATFVTRTLAVVGGG